MGLYVGAKLCYSKIISLNDRWKNHRGLLRDVLEDEVGKKKRRGHLD